MDLGIAGKKAIVCGSSTGLGRACAEALLAEGAQVIVNGRDAARLDAAAADMAARFGDAVIAVRGDVSTPEGRAALLERCPDADILVNNSAGPSPDDFANIEEDEWRDALQRNMVSPLLLIRALLPGMKERRFGRIVNITSAVVTSPRPHMTHSSGARAGLMAACKGLSLEVARYNVTINNMLPERFDTARQVFMAKAVERREGVSYEEARRRQVESIAARRLGQPEEFGATCAFFCSRFAGFMSGMNLHLDGGSYAALV